MCRVALIQNEAKVDTMAFQTNEKVNKRLHAVLAVLVLSAWLTPAAQSAQGNASGDTAFVDSVYEWGSWELGLAPAAGSPVAPKNHTLKIRQRNLQFRPHDNSAFRNEPAVMNMTETTSPAPVPPAIPTSGPLDGPIPQGSPGDRFQ